MLSVTVRAYSEAEKRLLAARLPTRYQRAESFVANFAFVVGLLMLPFALLERYFPASSQTQAIVCLVVLAFSLGLVGWIQRKSFGSRAKELYAIATGQAEVLHVCTSRAVERADPEDFGTAFYLEISANEDGQLLYLQGQYLDELEEATFPTTEFKLVRRLDTQEVIGFELIGQYFAPERIIPAFPMAQWRAGHTPTDGDILPGCLEDLT